MAATATISSKFKISIPTSVRKELHWEVGQELAFVPKGAGVLLISVPELSQLAGIAKGANLARHRDREIQY